jgi:glutamate dehydrogenase
VSSEQQQNLRLYVVNKANYGSDEADPAQLRDELDINKIGDRDFLVKASAGTKEIYQNILRKAARIPGPVIESYDAEVGEKRIVICYRRGTTTRFFGALTDLYHYHGFVARKKFVEQFANGFLIVCLYLTTPASQPAQGAPSGHRNDHHTTLITTDRVSCRVPHFRRG